MGAQGGYRYFVLKREGQDGTLGDLKTRLSYHGLFGGLMAGVEFQDSYVRDIRYGPMIGYTMGKALSATGTGLDDGLELAASQLEGGYLHTITVGSAVGVRAVRASPGADEGQQGGRSARQAAGRCAGKGKARQAAQTGTRQAASVRTEGAGAVVPIPSMARTLGGAAT